MNWSTACPDWEQRLINRQSIIPPPIFPTTAEYALSIFKKLRITDLPGKPTFGEVSEQWVFDFVLAIFGAYDERTGKQLIREFYLLISKKNTKSTIAAGIMLTAVIICWREDEEHLILAPTKEVADNSFKPAAGMVRAEPKLTAIFHVQDHIRTITHRATKASLKVVAADTDTVSGKKSGRILVDEHWLFGKRMNAEGMFMEATGGQISRDEGWIIYLTTQSDEPPAGVFKDKIEYFRKVRDGDIHDPKSLGILYEFPRHMVKGKAYLQPENFYITNPNEGRSVSAEWLADNLKKVLGNTDGSLQKFLAKHLNIEIGLNLRADRWPGADFWLSAEDCTVTLDEILAKSDVLTAGIDGGGLDDLLGFAVIGRDAEDSRIWRLWTRAWVHPIALERRKTEAPRYRGFEKDGDLVIVEEIGDDIFDLCSLVERLEDSGLLDRIGVDPAGINDIVDAIVETGIDYERVVGISQGWRMNGAIKAAERRVAEKNLIHGGQPLMNWCVSNARVEPKGNAVLITKQASGTGKIDPLIATLMAVALMAMDPEPRSTASVYEKRGVLAF
ncbi:terminase large subunit [Desulfobulbus rhabdoformis]|uniref:terminase large subunit n=1 Tax=Desulfobulbus rhabdoformis TaxID=34032 RepID=UPI00196632AE|nr:terminase large subunit [Desulfobulbus rhabdoformis]MBM9615318.1 terminase large subunit [Desulfobulbus rhabdoformis]